MADWKCVICLVIWLGLVETASSHPQEMRRFLFGGGRGGGKDKGSAGFSNRISTGPPNSNQAAEATTATTAATTTTGNPIKFVPIITFLIEFLKSLLLKLGILDGLLNRFPLTGSTNANLTEEMAEEESAQPMEGDKGDEDESDYLVECDASHLGLWPDKSNSQRYYKCEVDPRTPSLGDCLKEYFREVEDNKTTEISNQGLLVPLVRPCFMVTMMKCANGYKYSHKARICIPDVVFN